MSLYITGSLAYDRIMTFPGKFVDSILPDHLHDLNVSFFIEHLDEKLGGNAGNIAYTLHLLEEKPIIVSSAGSKDFERYQARLQDLGLSLAGITIKDNQNTAGCYITTDQENRQIAAFHAAALTTPSAYTFPNLNEVTDFALVGPSNPADMIEHPLLYSQNGVKYIFDPAQQLPILPAEHITTAIQGAYLLMGNDYEINMISEITGHSREQLTTMTSAGMIVTHGAEGSIVFEKGKPPTSISIVKVENVVDPTGAGDAYRAGTIKGILAGTTLPQAASLGAACAAYCLEHKGTQVHHFTLTELKERYEATFGNNSFPLHS